MPYGTINNLNPDYWCQQKKVWDKGIAPETLFFACECVLRVNGAAILFLQELYYQSAYNQRSRELAVCILYGIEERAFRKPAECPQSTSIAVWGCVRIFKSTIPDIPIPAGGARRILDFAGIKSYKSVNNMPCHQRAEHFGSFGKMQFGLWMRSTYDELILRSGIDRMPGFMTYDEMVAIHRRAARRVFNLPPGRECKPNVLEYERETKRYYLT